MHIKNFANKELVLFSITYVLYNFAYLEVLPVVNYMWKQTISFSIEEFFWGYAMLFLIYLCTSQMNSIFKTGYTILLVVIYMPVVAVSNVILVDSFYVISIFFFIFFSSIVALIISISKPENHLNIRIASLSPSLFLKLVKLISLILVCSFIVKNWSSFNFNIINVATNIYQIRHENKMDLFDAYSSRFMLSIISPILIFYGMKYKDKVSIILAFLISYMLFSVYAMKIQMLYFFLYLFFGFCIYVRSYSVSSVLYLFTFFVLTLSALMGVIGLNLLDRFLFLPGLLNILYLDFFSTNELNMFQGSKLELLFGGSSYGEALGYIIDGEYFGGGMNANTGFIASFYAETGAGGLIAAFTLFNLTLYFLNLIDAKIQGVGILLAISFVFELVNAPITNLYLTNSFALIFVIPFLINKHKENKC